MQKERENATFSKEKKTRHFDLKVKNLENVRKIIFLLPKKGYKADIKRIIRKEESELICTMNLKESKNSKKIVQTFYIGIVEKFSES